MPIAVTPETQAEFDWFEIFESGEQTDSAGRTHNYTQQDLLEMAQTPSMSAALVIGHPETDDPAWGWGSAYKVEGNKLYAQGAEVDVEFAQAVANKRFPNRSVRIRQTPDGKRIQHIGFLGGKKPAVEGLKWQFSAQDDDQVFEFSASDEIDYVTIQTAGIVQRVFSGIKNWFIEKEGAEKAEKIIPEWELNSLSEQTAIARHEIDKDRRYSEADKDNQPEDIKEDEVSAEELKAAQDALAAEKQKNEKLEFNQRVTAAQTFISEKVNGGKAPRLTHTEGLAEFMAGLGDGDKIFDFSAGDGDGKTERVSQRTWFENHLMSLPEQTALSRDFSKDENDDSASLDMQTKARLVQDYVSSEAGKGRTITVTTATQELKKQGKI